MANTYLDSDGLLRKYGTSKGVATNAGEFRHNGALRQMEVKIDLTTLTDTAAIISDVTFFPRGARIEEVEVVTLTAATSGGSAVLNVGLIGTDRSTVIDADAFVSAMAKTAVDAAGEKTVLRVGSTGAGSSIGTTTSAVGYITADYDTAAFTAGVVLVRIYYMVP